MRQFSALWVGSWAYFSLGALLTLAQAPSGGSPPQPGAGAQQASPGPPQGPKLRLTTRLVLVSVLAQDKKGEPVGDLKKEDFSLLDQGQAQPISVFSLETGQPFTIAAGATAAPHDPTVYSNRISERTGVAPNATIILLDMLNTKFGDVAYARQQIVHFLGQLQPQDRVAIYALGARLRILHEFSQDATSLLKALGRLKPEQLGNVEASKPEPFMASGLADVGITTLDEAMGDVRARQAEYNIRVRVDRTVETLEIISRHVSGLAGRKNLIWVSGGFPFSMDLEHAAARDTAEWAIFRQAIERAARALDGANIAVYPVDARGLVAPASVKFEGFHGTTSSATLDARLPEDMLNLEPDRVLVDTMTTLADRTGGQASYHANDIDRAIRRALDDSRLSYVLGFFPTHKTWDGKFHEIKVQVNRPGVKIRYRKGYFALPEIQPDLTQRQQILREAAFSPVDATSLAMSVRAAQSQLTSGQKTIKLELRIEPREVSLEEKDGLYTGSLDFLFAQTGPDGSVLNGEAQSMNIRLTPEQYVALTQTGITLRKQYTLASSATHVRVIAHDNESGSTGSISIPIQKVMEAPPTQ